MAFWISSGLFVVFVANVIVGAVTGPAWFGNVVEALLLFAASIAFVAGILAREAAARSRDS